MRPIIFVRSGFASIKPRIEELSQSELERLTSNTKSISENIDIEFEIEKEVMRLGSTLGILFEEHKSFDELSNHYSLRDKSLSFNDQMTLVKELNLPIPSTFQIHEPSVLEPPFIIKNSESRKGREVYFIKDKPALNKVYDFLSSKEAYVPSLGGLVTYDASIENKKFIKQEYIKTPSNHFTTYRITVSCVGEIFSSCITYSGTTKNSPQLLQSTYLDNWTNKDLLTLTDSPFYIGSQKIVSNKSAGGGWIVINRTTNSKLPSNTEKRILREHGLDEESPKTPALLKNLSINIAKYLGSKGKGMIFGIDWIQSTDNRLYYIETNVSPAAMPYMYSHQNGEGTHQDGMTTMLRETIKNIAQQ